MEEDKSEAVCVIGLGVAVGLLMAAGIVWAFRAILGRPQSGVTTIV